MKKVTNGNMGAECLKFSIFMVTSILNDPWFSYWSFWPKWNFKPAWDSHVDKIYPKRNKCRLADTVFIAGVISLTQLKFHFWWWNKILHEMKCLRKSIKISGRFKMQPKWNVIWTELLFTVVWNLQPVWVHFVNLLLVNELLNNKSHCAWSL